MRKSQIQIGILKQAHQLTFVRDVINETAKSKELDDKSSFNMIPYYDGSFIISSLDQDNMFIMFDHPLIPPDKFYFESHNAVKVGNDFINKIIGLLN